MALSPHDGCDSSDSSEDLDDNADVSLQVHYGPVKLHIAAECTLFAVALQLISETTPHILLEDDTDLSFEDGSRPRGPCREISQFPVAHISSWIVSRFSNAADGARTIAKSSPRHASMWHDPLTDDDDDERVDDTVRCRPAFEIRTHTFGSILVSDCGQWEAARELVLSELMTTTPLLAAICSRYGETLQRQLTIHAEIVFLWFDGDTLRTLRYADVVTDGRAVDSPQHSTSASSHPIPRTPTQRNTPLRPQNTPQYPFERDMEALQSGPGAPHPREPVASIASHHCDNLFVSCIDLQDEHGGVIRGIPLRIAEPIVARAELLQAARSLLGMHQRQSIRLAYRVVPWQEAVAAAAAAPAWVRRGRDRALQPLETQSDVEHLVHDVLAYGYRSIRMVCAPTADDNGGAPLGHGDEGWGAAACGQEEAAARISDSSEEERADHRELSQIAVNPSPHQDSDEGITTNERPPQAIPLSQTNTVAREGPPEEATVVSQGDASPGTHPNGNDVTVLHSVGAAAIDHEAPEATSAVATTVGPPSSPLQEPEDGGEEPPAVTQSGTNDGCVDFHLPHSPSGCTPPHDSANSSLNCQQQRATPSPLGSARLPGHLSSHGSIKDRQKRAVVVVRYEVDPTEIHVAGPVSSTLLGRLADDIYTLCCTPHNNRCGILYPPTQFARICERQPTTESAASAADSGWEDGPRCYYIMPLHPYNFNAAEEESLERCIAETMRSLEGYSPLSIPALNWAA